MDKYLSVVFGSIAVIAVIAVIGLWYLTLFAIALIIFVIVLWVASSEKSRLHKALQFRPGKLIPASVWEAVHDIGFTDGPSRYDISWVELDKYADNWEKFIERAQVQRAGTVELNTHLLCYQTPTSDKGILLVHDRLVLGEMRRLDLDVYFDYFWRTGGAARTGSRFRFDENLTIQSATSEVRVHNEVTDGPGRIPAWESWLIIWRGVRGKK